MLRLRETGEDSEAPADTAAVSVPSAMSARVLSALIAAASVWAATLSDAADDLQMKNTKKITFSAITAALAVVVMLGSYFPYLTYSIPAIASLFLLLPTLEFGARWGWLSYGVASAITLLTGELEAQLIFVMVIGYYPVLKECIERIKIKPLAYLIKLAVFNASLAAFYFVITGLAGVDPSEYGMGMKYGQFIFAALANVVFFVFDAAITRLTFLYFLKYHDRVKKFLK